MKKFTDHTFDFEVYERELSEFKALLDSKAELSERDDILPFFKARPNLSSQIATLIPHMVNNEKIASSKVLDVSTLSKGIYMIRLVDIAANTSSVQKLILQ